MQIKPDDIRTLAEMVWETTLGIPLAPDDTAQAGSQVRSTVGSVQITGAWNGAVLLDCGSEVARMAAAGMFCVGAEKVTMRDMQDAVAELVNILGGNIKAQLPEQCFLSLPSVVEGTDYSARVPGSRVVNRECFSCMGQRVTITVVERINERRQSSAA